MKHKQVPGSNPEIYNSNNQKRAEPLPSTRNVNNGSLFVSGVGSQAVHRAGANDASMNENLQKSGDQVHRQNSFALHGNGKSRASTFGSQRNVTVTLNGIKQRFADNSSGAAHMQGNHPGPAGTSEGFHAREPNETTLMKARPATSIRVSSKSHYIGFGGGGAAAGSHTNKYQSRTFGANRTNENNIGGGQAQLI